MYTFNRRRGQKVNSGLNQIAHLQLLTGNVDFAEKSLQEALKLSPAYHYPLANLAKVRTAQQKHQEAVELLQQLNEAAPNPENLYTLVKALERAGRLEEAEVVSVEFEKKARRELEWRDNANRELIFFYADHARNPAEALRIARKEIAILRDVHTLDAYAWALYVNGEYGEARKQIEEALEVGIRDAKLFYHAGVITSKLNDWPTAELYLKQSLDLNPLSEVAADAREALAVLTLASAVAAKDLK